jgi:hypothetical protein
MAPLMMHAEFLTTTGQAPVAPLANPRPAMAPAFGPGSTKIMFPVRPTHPPIRRKPKG